MSNNLDPKRERRLDELLREAGAVPPSPDCRDAVMARISRRSMAWAYALAVSLLVFGVAGAIVLCRPHQPPVQKIVKKTPEQRPAPVVKQETAEREPEAIRHETVSKPAPPKQVVRPVREQQRRPVEKPRPHRRLIAPAPKPDLQVMKPGIAPPPVALEPEADTPAVAPASALDERPVALVVVTWPSSHDTGDVSYSYKEVDAETGDSTDCSVTRSGDSIDVRMQSTPGGDKPPVKGCVEHESQNNV